MSKEYAESMCNGLMDAAKNMDWGQVVCNGGPPCFHVEGGKFCGAAERWAGHRNAEVHKFIPLSDLIEFLQRHWEESQKAAAFHNDRANKLDSELIDLRGYLEREISKISEFIKGNISE